MQGPTLGWRTEPTLGFGEMGEREVDKSHSYFLMCMRNGRHILIGLALVLVAGSVVYVASALTLQRRAESYNCASSVVSICTAGRMWAEDHEGRFPTNFVCMTNELGTPKVLSCVPARRTRDWSEFTSNHCTYEIVTPGVHRDAGDTIFLRCTIHGHLGYPDMTVYDGVRRRGKNK